MADVRILKAAYHRNGVSGNGFYVAIFQDGDGSKKLGVFFGEGEDGDAPSMSTAIFDLDLLKQEVIRFGENSFRGDHYAHLIKPVADYLNKRFEEEQATRASLPPPLR